MSVIPSGAELPLLGNSAQSRDLEFALPRLIRVSLRHRFRRTSSNPTFPGPEALCQVVKNPNKDSGLFEWDRELR